MWISLLVDYDFSDDFVALNANEKEARLTINDESSALDTLHCSASWASGAAHQKEYSTSCL
jgi:hypothetical protein